MEKLDKVIAGLECCLDEDRDCKECPYYREEMGCLDDLMVAALEVVRELGNDVISQSGTILYLNRDLERCRKALNAQGEYAYLGGDLISREALVERLENVDWYSTNAEGVLHSGAADEESAFVRYADVAKVIEDALAVEAEPVVHARWIIHGRGMNNWCECSRCNTVVSPFWKRCPMCEAKMDEEVAE